MLVDKVAILAITVMGEVLNYTKNLTTEWKNSVMAFFPFFFFYSYESLLKFVFPSAWFTKGLPRRVNDYRLYKAACVF